MKKILTLLTGIVFLITILIAGGCSLAGDNGKPPRGLEEVTIYLKAFEMNGEKHLEMYDSNKPDSKVIDNLYTDVQDGTTVIWTLVNDSGIRKIKKIGPEKPGKIIVKDATGIILTKKKKLNIPDNQTPGDEEAYYIIVKDMDGNTWTIDPYLRIPDTI